MSTFLFMKKIFFLKLMVIIQIISMDQEHTKFVLATGFQRFWRGPAQKERMFVISL